MKILIIMVMVAAFSHTYAQLSPTSLMEAGHSEKVVRMYGIGSQENYPSIDRGGLYASLTLGVKYRRILLESTTTTYMLYNGNYGFSPWLSIYEININYEWRGVRIGAYHSCSHFSQSNQSYLFGYSDVESRAYIRINLINWER